LDRQPAWRRLHGSPRGWALGNRLEREVEYRGEFGVVEVQFAQNELVVLETKGGP